MLVKQKRSSNEMRTCFPKLADDAYFARELVYDIYVEKTWHNRGWVPISVLGQTTYGCCLWCPDATTSYTVHLQPRESTTSANGSSNENHSTNSSVAQSFCDALARWRNDTSSDAGIVIPDFDIVITKRTLEGQDLIMRVDLTVVPSAMSLSAQDALKHMRRDKSSGEPGSSTSSTSVSSRWDRGDADIGVPGPEGSHLTSNDDSTTRTSRVMLAKVGGAPSSQKSEEENAVAPAEKDPDDSASLSGGVINHRPVRETLRSPNAVGKRSWSVAQKRQVRTATQRFWRCGRHFVEQPTRGVDGEHPDRLIRVPHFVKLLQMQMHRQHKARASLLGLASRNDGDLGMMMGPPGAPPRHHSLPLGTVLEAVTPLGTPKVTPRNAEESACESNDTAIITQRQTVEHSDPPELVALPEGVQPEPRETSSC